MSSQPGNSILVCRFYVTHSKVCHFLSFLMCNLCWTNEWALNFLETDDWVNVTSDLVLLARAGALFYFQQTVVPLGMSYRDCRSDANRCPSASMSVFEAHLLSVWTWFSTCACHDAWLTALRRCLGRSELVSTLISETKLSPSHQRTELFPKARTLK